MAHYHNVVWNEGMFLLPHHFQQWNRYQQNLLHFGRASMQPFHWGLLHLEINREGIENGMFMLLSCRGILPGGFVVDIPELDEAPPSRTIEAHFDPAKQTLGVYLAVPVERLGSANCRINGSDGSRETRYVRESVQVPDMNTGDNAQEISIARKNWQVLFEGESFDDHNYIKIAELERTPNIALKADYIPPCLSISASPWLIQTLRSLIERLVAKSDAFDEQCRQMEDEPHGFSVADVLNLERLQAINGFIPELNHFYRTEQGHPETLYRLVTQFAGRLTAFSRDIRPTDLPAYQHDNLASSFGALNTHIQNLLEMLVPIKPPPPPEPPPSKYRLIRLKDAREPVYEYAIEADLFDPSYRFYVAFKGRGDGRELIDDILRRVKIASADEIDFLIGRALRGLVFEYSPSPPPDIPVKSGYCYFALATQGDYWEGIQRSKSLAFYVPTSFEEIEFEVIAVKEEEV